MIMRVAQQPDYRFAMVQRDMETIQRDVRRSLRRYHWANLLLAFLRRPLLDTRWKWNVVDQCEKCILCCQTADRNGLLHNLRQLQELMKQRIKHDHETLTPNA